MFFKKNVFVFTDLRYVFYSSKHVCFLQQISSFFRKGFSLKNKIDQKLLVKKNKQKNPTFGLNAVFKIIGTPIYN